MPWLSLSLALPQAEAERLSDALLEAGAQSVTIESAIPGEGPIGEFAWPMGEFAGPVRLTALVPRDADAAALFAGAALAAGIAPPDFEVSEVKDEDWVRRSQAQFTPIRVAQRLWIVPTWHEPPDPQALVVRLDPGLAFGTGSHASTRLVLQYLESTMRPGASVLDYGCGSGILAIAAAKLGASRIAATDIDPQALVTTAENAAANGVRLDVSPLDALGTQTFDLVLANILAAPLITLEPLLSARTRAGGAVVLAGILDEQAEEVAAAYSGHFDIRVGARLEGWSRLDGIRRGARP